VEEMITSFLREIFVLSHVEHPNIIKFLGASLGRNLCLVTEFCQYGSLNKFMQTKPLGWSFKVKFATDIAEAMNYLHTQTPPIVHRDLKCSNILVSEGPNVKLSDFGLSQRLLYGAANSAVGTIAWAAPEVLIKQENYTTKADVYSYGTIMWEILNDGANPYTNKNELETLRAIQTGEKPPINQSLVEPNYLAILKQCWSNDKQDRPSFLRILEYLKRVETDWKSK